MLGGGADGKSCPGEGPKSPIHLVGVDWMVRSAMSGQGAVVPRIMVGQRQNVSGHVFGAATIAASHDL